MWRRSRSCRWRSSSTSEDGRAPSALPVALVLAVAAAVAGCSAFDVFRPAPAGPAAPAAAAVVAVQPVEPAKPEAPKRIAFDHRFHLSKGPACADCHEDTEKSDKAAMPKLEFCLDCHTDIDAKKPAEKTVAAFLDKPGGTPQWSHVTAQAPGIVFSHKTHLAKGVECAQCHKGIEESTAVTKDLFVDMDACTKCHAEKNVKNDCATCHKEAAQSLAAGKGPFWAPSNHDKAWRAAHGPVSRLAEPRRRAERCDDCHGQPGFPANETCANCHAATKPADHDKLWRGAHGQIVRGDPAKADARCSFCHDGPSFPQAATCATCHVSTKPADHEKLWQTMHGQTVRRDPGQVTARCASCHGLPKFPTESKCLGCHATQAPRDHSQSWRVDAGHGLAAAMDRERCEACHTMDACVACHTTMQPRNHRGGWGPPRDTHCANCHLPLSLDEPGGCGVCHKSTPSHHAAPRMPSQPPHRPDMQCRQCHNHSPHLKHFDNGTNCLVCHR